MSQIDHSNKEIIMLWVVAQSLGLHFSREIN